MADLKFIDGTESKQDYLIVSESGKYVAGLKGTVGSVKGFIMVVMRIRVIHRDGKGSASGIGMAFPNAPMTNVNKTRGSFLLTCPIPTPSKNKAIPIMLTMTSDKGFIEGSIGSMIKCLQPHPLCHPVPVIADWLQQAWEKEILEASAKLHGLDAAKVEAKVADELAKFFSKPGKPA